MTDIVVLGNRNAGRGRANKALPELLDARLACDRRT